jgi:hypothetical protein
MPARREAQLRRRGLKCVKLGRVIFGAGKNKLLKRGRSLKNLR